MQKMEQVQTDDKHKMEAEDKPPWEKAMSAASMTEITPSAYRASREWMSEMKGFVLLNEGARGKAGESFSPLTLLLTVVT